MLSKETFEKELEICRAQFHRQKGCAWGKCENCGAPFLLQKLYKGEVIEEKEKVVKFKKDILQ